MIFRSIWTVLQQSTNVSISIIRFRIGVEDETEALHCQDNRNVSLILAFEVSQCVEPLNHPYYSRAHSIGLVVYARNIHRIFYFVSWLRRFRHFITLNNIVSVEVLSFSIIASLYYMVFTVHLLLVHIVITSKVFRCCCHIIFTGILISIHDYYVRKFLNLCRHVFLTLNLTTHTVVCTLFF